MSALMGYRNLVDAAVITATSSLAGYPATNMQLRQLSKSWRASASGGARAIVNFGTPKNFMLVGLLGINASARSSTDATIEYSADGLSWTEDDGVVLPIDGGSPDLPRCIIVRIPPSDPLTKRRSQYVRVTPNWARPAGQDYYEVGRLWISDAIEFPDGPDSVWTLLANDTGNLDASRGEQNYEDKGSRGRAIRASFRAMKTEQAYGFGETDTSTTGAPSVDDLFMAVGKTGELVFVPRADNQLWVRRTAIYGHLTPESLALPHLAGDRYSWDFTVEEEF